LEEKKVAVVPKAITGREKEKEKETLIFCRKKNSTYVTKKLHKPSQTH